MPISHIRHDSGIVEFTFSGNILGGDETTMLHSALHEYINAGDRRFVMDMMRVT